MLSILVCRAMIAAAARTWLGPISTLLRPGLIES